MATRPAESLETSQESPGRGRTGRIETNRLLAPTTGAPVDGSEIGEGDLLDVGLYTAAEASRLIGIPPARLRRWLRGYTYRLGDTVAGAEPVWRRQVPDIDGAIGLGFLDLMEARFVDAFRRANVPWPVIRRCAERARELVGADHPFSSQRFRTGGHTIFAEVANQAGEAHLLDLARNQMAFGRIIGPGLYAGIEFSSRLLPARWWPLGLDVPVVIDPARAFGQPIVSGTSIPTKTLADAVAAEGSIAPVARLFEIEPRSVRAALRFEQRHVQRLAA
jgi:uncharacterized protein (DUF433 family)